MTFEPGFLHNACFLKDFLNIFLLHIFLHIFFLGGGKRTAAKAFAAAVLRKKIVFAEQNSKLIELRWVEIFLCVEAIVHFVHLFICSFVDSFIYASVHTSIYLSIYLSLSVYLPIYLSIHLFVQLSIVFIFCTNLLINRLLKRLSGLTKRTKVDNYLLML